MDIPTLATFTAILRAPEAAAAPRRWSAHCLDLDLGVVAQSAAAVRMRLACSIAAEVSVARDAGRSVRRASADRELWDTARRARLVARQTVETDAGAVEVRYVQPGA